MPGGRPPHYTDPAELEAKIDEYFQLCDEGEEREVYDSKRKAVRTIRQQIPYTVPGLALHLGFKSRQSFIDYARRGDGEFSDTITRAKMRIEAQRNVKMLTGETDSRSSQFDLMNNFGWTNKTEQHSTQDTRIQVEVVGMPQLPASAVAVLQGQPQAIGSESVTGLVTDTDDDVVDAEVTTQED